jgi:predicted component of type VI protein secretion system
MGVRITTRSLWSKGSDSTFVYEFAQSRIIIGRSRSADVQLPHAAVSGTHASIRTHGAGYALVDEGSTNGTRVNEALLVPGRPKPLRANDVVDLGGYQLRIEVGVPVAHTMSARITADFAKQMLGEQLCGATSKSLEAQLAEIQSCADQPVDLLPIAEASPTATEPPRESRPSRPRASRPDPSSVAPPAPRLRRSELAVYALAALVVATSVIAMTLLMRS